jgi:hypothetical protein
MAHNVCRLQEIKYAEDGKKDQWVDFADVFRA